MTTTETSNPTYITPTPKEIDERKLSPQNVERALYALHFDGIVILQNIIDHAHLDALNEVMVKDAVYIAGLGDKSPYNYHKGTSPFFGPYL
jgi:hypothetical protein